MAEKSEFALTRNASSGIRILVVPKQNPMEQHRHPRWWGTPENFDERKNDRKISWLELFYDLVYVAAIAQLTHHLAAHPSWQVAAFSFLMFSLVFWSWVNGSQYYDLHGSDSIRTRIFTFGQMLAVAGVAITLGGTFEGHHAEFSVAFLCVEAVITYLWWSTGCYDPSHRIFNRFYVVNYCISLILLMLSVFTGYRTAVILWGVVLLFNLTPPLTVAKTIAVELRKRGQVFTASAALVERFWLITIIVLAESILATVTGVSEMKDSDPMVWVSFILSIFLSFLVCSLYFDLVSVMETKKGYRYMQWFIFLHYPLLGGLCMVGACLKPLLMGTADGTVRLMFCLSLAAVLLLIMVLANVVMEEDDEDRSYIRPVTRLLIGSMAVLVAIPFTGIKGTPVFLGIVCLTLFIPVVLGIRNWVRFKFFSEK